MQGVNLEKIKYCEAQKYDVVLRKENCKEKIEPLWIFS